MTKSEFVRHWWALSTRYGGVPRHTTRTRMLWATLHTEAQALQAESQLSWDTLASAASWWWPRQRSDVRAAPAEMQKDLELWTKLTQLAAVLGCTVEEAEQRLAAIVRLP